MAIAGRSAASKTSLAVALAIALVLVGLGAGRGERVGVTEAGEVVGVRTRAHGEYQLRYRSIGVRGEVVDEEAVVWLPPGARSGDVVAWAHQTTGLADQCAPSDRPAVEVPGRDALLAAGAIVVAPDYEGLGTSGVHPYLVGRSEGRSVLDALRAARSMTGVRGRSVVYGWSQGGHAALFAARLAPTYAPDVRLAGVAAIAPVTDMPALVDGTSPLSQLPGVVAMVTAGYVAAYPRLRADTLLDAPGRQLDVARGVCKVADALAGTTTDPPSRTWTWHLRQNDPAGARLQVPVLMTQGDLDWLLPIEDAEAAYDRLCANGSLVHMVRFTATDHASVPATSLPDVFRWLHQRLAGEPINGGCVQVTRSPR